MPPLWKQYITYFNIHTQIFTLKKRQNSDEVHSSTFNSLVFLLATSSLRPLYLMDIIPYILFQQFYHSQTGFQILTVLYHHKSVLILFVFNIICIIIIILIVVHNFHSNIKICWRPVFLPILLKFTRNMDHQYNSFISSKPIFGW